MQKLIFAVSLSALEVLVLHSGVSACSVVWFIMFVFTTAGWIKHLPSTFGVQKGEKDPIVVTLPRELQGKSELLVFLGPHPVKSKNKFHSVNIAYIFVC